MAKSSTPIPPGFHTLTWHMCVPETAKYIDFLKAAFGAVEISRSPGPGGKIMHATVRVGDSMMMVNDDFTAEFKMPPYSYDNTPFYIHMYVPDADATFAQAIAAGCAVLMPLSDQFWGDRYGHLRDPFGVKWAIATKMEDLTPEEIHERQVKAFSAGHP